MNKILKDRIKLIRAMINVKMYYLNDNGNFKASAFYVFTKIIDSIRKDSDNHFLSLSQEDPTYISYANHAQHKYDNSKRVKTTLGRYISRNFDKEIKSSGINQKVLNDFVSSTLGIINKDFVPSKIQIKIGQEIIDHYLDCDETNHSCMTGEESFLTKLYALNPEKVSLLVYDELRALLWTCDDGTKVLDRIYPVNHYKSVILHHWAKDNGYVFREEINSRCSYNLIKLSDNSIRKVTLNLDKSYTKFSFPYLDTFRFGRFSNHRLVRLTNKSKSQKFCFVSTDGDYDKINLCNYCGKFTEYGERTDEDTKFYCRRCYYKYTKLCCRCTARVFSTVKINNKHYCLNCSKKFYKCTYCSTYCSCYMLENKKYCNNCEANYFKCNYCKNLYEHNRVLELDKNIYCCSRCLPTCNMCYNKISTISGRCKCDAIKNISMANTFTIYGTVTTTNSKIFRAEGASGITNTSGTYSF